MEFTIERTILSSALSQLSRVASGERAVIPITMNVAIVAQPDNRVSLTATSLEIDLRIVLPAEVKATGATTVSASHLDKWVAAVKGAQIKFRMTEKRLNLSVERANSWLAPIPIDEFPSIQFGAPDDELPVAVVDGKELLRAIKQVLFSASTSDTRVALSAVYFDIQPGNDIVLATTDGFRLSKRVVIGETHGQAGLLMSRITMVELERVLSSASGEVRIFTNGKRVQFLAGDVSFATLVVDAPYVAYQQLLEGVECVTTIEAERDDLITALKTTRIFATAHEMPFVQLASDTSAVHVRAEGGEVGTCESEVEATITGGPMDSHYNATLLIEALGVLNGPHVRLLNNVRKNGTIVTPMLFLEEDGYTHVLTPMA